MMKCRSKKTRRGNDPAGRLGSDPSTVRNPHARPRAGNFRVWPQRTIAPPRVVERQWPRAECQWGWVADIRGQCVSEIRIACWQIWHRCRYLAGQVDVHVKYLEVPRIAAPTRAEAIEQLARRMVGFAVAEVEVYAVDLFEPQKEVKPQMNADER